MSDGNYNRNLLPYRQYESGLRAGRAQARTTALRAFSQWLEEQGYDEESREKHLLRFREIMGA